MINICNLRNAKVKEVYDIKVDRSSVLGNKFYMHDENERTSVCEAYEVWFNTQIKNKNEIIIKELNRLCDIYKTYGKLNLFCWCAPKRCHAETIKKYIEKINKHK